MAANSRGATAKASGASKSNPAAEKAKAELRRLVLSEIGPRAAHVFDAFAGDGAMYRAVWKDAATYVGCDTDWHRDGRTSFVADSKRVIRSLDLSTFTIFDFDANGSPWEQALILAARRPLGPGEKLGLLLTEGSSPKLKMGGYPAALRILAGLRGMPAGGGENQSDLTDRAIAGLCRRMVAHPVRRWQAQAKTGAKLVYIGLVLEGNPG